MPYPDTDTGTTEQEVFAALHAFAGAEALPMIVRGASMQPRLAAGQRVCVRKKRCYFPGDIIMYRAWDGSLYIHRLLGYRRQAGHWSIVARGDAARNCDAPVHVHRVVGKVVAIDMHPWRAGIPDRLKAFAGFTRYLATAVARSFQH